MKKKHALIFANGAVSSFESALVSGQIFDAVICADGGVKHALNYHFSPDVVIGDLDSLSAKAKEQLSRTKIISRPSQELNDLEKTLIYCQNENITDITLLGAFGNRLDHTLNNLSVLSRYIHFHFTLYDDYAQIFLVKNVWQYSGKLGQTISLIPMGIVEGVTTKGLAFPLNNESLAFGIREGLSNYIIKNPAEVQIKSGTLFIYVLLRGLDV